MRNRCELEPDLEARLKRLRLRLETPDDDTLAVKHVPANRKCFSKPRTNLLVKRPVEGRPCFVCVDEDLRYTGTDQALARAFAAAPAQQGWRILSFGGSLDGNLASALEYAFSMLGAGEPAEPAPELNFPRAGGLLSTWAKDLTQAVEPECTLFRDEEMEQVAGCVLGWQGRMALVLGEPGTGKTNLLSGIAQFLRPYARSVLGVNAGALMAGTLFESERESLLQVLLAEARESGAVLALEQAEWMAAGVPRSALPYCAMRSTGARGSSPLQRPRTRAGLRLVPSRRGLR